jgi:MFS family permease
MHNTILSILQCVETNAFLMAFFNKFKTFESFSSPAFRLYYFGMLGQWVAMSMQQVTQSFLVYELTGSTAILGIIALATALPQLAMCFLGGALADRFQKKRLLQISQLIAALIAFIIVAALMTGYMSKDHAGSWWVLIVTAILSGICNGISLPVRQSMIPELVSNKQLMNAVSISTVGQNIFMLVGPAIAGFLIDAIGFTYVYGIMGSFYLLAVILTNFIPAVKIIQKTGGNTLIDIWEGLKYVRGNPTILLIIIFTLMAVLLGMPRNQMMPVFAKDILHVGATGQGVLQSVTSVGALLASLTFASILPKKRGLIMILCTLNLGIAIAIFAFSRSYPLSIGMMIFIGIGQTGHTTMGTVLLQTLTDRAYVGRVMSIMMTYTALGNLGSFLVGITAQFVGAPWAVGGFAMGLVLISLLALIFIPKVRKLD